VKTDRENPVPFEVLSVTGLPEVAEVAVLRFRDDDRFLVEAVDGLEPPIPRDRKWILNVSTQFGCPVGCPFCDAGGLFRGNLTADEMLAQVRWGLDRHPGLAERCGKLKIHFARMGEPALNDAVIQALERLPGVAGSAGLWGCVATVAPRGREGWFEALARVKQRLYQGRFQLQFSVQSTDPQARARLIPVPHWGLHEIAAWSVGFHREGDRKVLLNFALARDVPFHAGIVAATFEPEVFAVKLTPVNPTARGSENGFLTRLRGDADPDLDSAVEDLRARGFDVILSVGDPREDQVGSNCGQAVRMLAVGA
jgi:23S rRNA (adenine2503-C2)-methyltransferase